ncbi:MAG: carboxypeptidase-like regulatory domain-containing protein [Acidobacteriota bacterium]
MMLRVVRRSAAVLCVWLLLPAAALAQAAITGLVKDASGGVLPGVTVEVASPVLIEKVRSVTTDATGQYRVVDLRPGSYSVTISVAGFKTVKRDGIELTGTFVATVNAELAVGALAETVTVSGQSPTVDIQSVLVQQTLSSSVIAAIPSSRNASGIQSLIPGLNVSQAGVSVGGGDAGGVAGGMGGLAGTIHGGNQYGSRTKTDGLNTDFTGQSAAGGQLLNTAGASEVVINTSGGLGEAEGAGVNLNIIPRDGGNTFSGSAFANGASRWMQGSNYTQSLKDQGLRTPANLTSLWDVDGMGGGRVVRDKLWFYLTYREVGSNSTVPGMWVNKNANNPNSWVVDFDLTQPAFTDTFDRHGIGRLTWQASRRHKLVANWQEQYNYIGAEGGGTPTQTPEGTGLTLFKPSRIQQATWTFAVTNRLLIEAGIGTYEGTYTQSGGGGPRIGGIGGVNNPLLIQQLEQTGNIPSCNCSIPGLISRHPGLANGGFSASQIGTQEWRASLSYVSGAHNMKFGYQGGFSTPTKNYYYDSTIIQVRTNNGVPNQITENLAYPGWLRTGRHVIPINLYAQDQWTRKRLTLQGGVRWDNGITNYTSDPIGGPDYILLPTQVSFPTGSTQGINWRDITPRVGVAYDLLGNGKTAVKFNTGKYTEGLSSLFGLDMNPIFRIPTMTNRPWLNPTNFNFEHDPGCDLRNPAAQPDCGAMVNQSFGTQVFSTNYDPNMVTGWGTRPYVWSTGVSVQQELTSGVALTVGYYRNSWGNLSVVDNTLTSVSDYTTFGIAAPLDSRLPGGGGQAILGLFDLNPNKVGQVSNLHQLGSNFGQETMNWQGVDLNINARLRYGLTVQGGTSTGRRLTDACEVRGVVPEATPSTAIVPAGGLLTSATNPYCRVVEPYRTSATGLATYMVPKVGVQVSATWQSNPGPDIAANYVASNAVIAAGPQPLGRNLSGGANVTVNLIQPGTLYGPRRNNLDLRLSKVLKFGSKRATISIDGYNLTNSDVVLAYNNSFVPGGAWLTPTRIASARYMKLGAQFDF